MTERQKTLLWKTTQAKRDRFAKRMEPTWKKALMAQIQPVLDEIDVSNFRDMEQRVQQLIRPEPIEEAFYKTLEVVGVYFARDTFEEVKKAYHPDYEIKQDPAIPKNEQWLTWVKQTLGIKAGERIIAMTGSSKERAIVIIKRILQEGTEEGLGASQMAIKLRDALGWEWGTDATYRAARIARTETTMASNLGSLTGAMESGEPMKKVWLSTRDSRTRRPKKGNRYDHYGKFPMGPDGETVDLKEAFKKTGEELQYPGDPAGSAGNNINCRCTHYFEPINTDILE